MSWEPIARRQHGVISHAQLTGHGLSAQAISRLLRSGRLQRRHSSVYLAAAAPLTFEARLWLAVLGTDGVLGYQTAAHVWGMVGDPPERIDVIVAVNPGRRRLPGARIHRTRLLARDRTTRHGLPITSLCCSAMDWLGRLPTAPGLRFADRALQQGWVTHPDLERRLTAQPGRTGNTRLRNILEITSDGAAAKSERLLHAILRRCGVTGWTANHRVDLDGSRHEIDVALPDIKLGIEVDGLAFHVDPDRFQRDRTRQNRLVTAGWTILRFTWLDLVDRPRYVIATIRRAILAPE